MTNAVKVLMVDDDIIERESVSRSFAEFGITNPMVFARDGVEALAIMRGSDGFRQLDRPYIVLLDLNMPRMNGLEFLQALRDDPLLADTLVIVLSTSDSVDDRKAAHELNVAGYITKAKLAEDFSSLARLLEMYWRLVEIP